eukprot:1348446-Pleurochrysis_carterae.AAC.4
MSSTCESDASMQRPKAKQSETELRRHLPSAVVRMLLRTLKPQKCDESGKHRIPSGRKVPPLLTNRSDVKKPVTRPMLRLSASAVGSLTGL